IAKGHPFEYQRGEPKTSGATSPLYVLLLAVFYLLGVRGHGLMVVALALALASLATTAVCLGNVAQRLGSNGCRWAVAICVFGWGWLVWQSGTGMETIVVTAVVAFAWDQITVWIGAAAENRTTKRAWFLVLLSWMLPLWRPDA